MDFEQLNIEQDLSINKYQLDSEAITLPGLYFRYSDAAREAKSLVSEKSDNLKVVTAERQLAIREQCANEGKKVTEAIIAAMVDSDPLVIEARKELREAESIYARINVAVSAMDTKRSEIDNLVKLYCNAYYANKDVKQDGEFQSDMVAHDMRSQMNPLPTK